MGRLLRIWIEGIVQDVRFAFRMFRDTPLFAMAAVLTLALGIAANTAIFSVVNAVLLNSLPFRRIQDPNRLVMIWEKSPHLSAFVAERMPVRVKDFREWQRSSKSFSEMGIWKDTTFNLLGEGGAGRKPERVTVAVASTNLLPLLGVQPALGRQFRADESQPGRDHVAILSDQLYRSRFGSDPQIIGKTLRADGVAYLIVGVLPADFELPAMWGGLDQKKMQLWIPMRSQPGAGGPEEQMNSFVYARLKPEVTIEQARAEMRVLQQGLARTDEVLRFFSGINVTSAADEDAGPELRKTVWVLQAAVGFVLLIACANVANLLLTRAVSREKEIAVRVALGAGQARLLRQMLTESLLLSACAGMAGIAGAWALLRLVTRLAPRDTHGLHEMRLDGTVLLYTLAVTVFAGVLFGLAPFWHARKQDINETLNRASRAVASSSSRLRGALIISELALSVVLLVGAGLMIRTLSALMTTDLGFRRDHLLSLNISLPEDRYGQLSKAEDFNRRLLDVTRQAPGVRSAMVTTGIPMQSVSETSFEIAGRQMKPNQHLVSNWARVSHGYFETLGMHLFEGRTLRAEDASSGPAAVAVVNRSFAHKYWPDGKALGQVIRFDGEDGKPAEYRVVGVVEDEHQLGPDAASHAEFYVPGRALKSLYLIVRTAGDPLQLAPAIENAIWKLDRDLPVANVRSMEGVLREWTGPRRFLMTVLLIFAALASVLAALGLYSVLSYSVTLRSREIGIRVALGAEPGRIARTIVTDGCKLTLAGIAIGLAGAFALVQFLESLVFGVSTTDPWVFVLVPILLTVIAAIASYAPAKRAAAVDPIEALRAE